MFSSRFDVLTSFVLVLMSPPTHAPVCLEGHLSVEKEYYRSYGVFIGQVLAERAVSESNDYLEGTAYSVSVDEVLHGHLPATIELFSENSSGRFPMDVGSRYLLFVYRALGRTMVDNCGNSGLLAETTTVLKTIRRLQAQGGRRG